MEVLESDPFMGEGQSFSVMLHTVTLLTLRSIVKGAMAVGLEDPEEPWDHLLGSFSEVSVPWLEKLSGMGDSIRRQAGRELIQVWLSGPVPDLIRMPPPQEDEPLSQAIARVRATSAEADGKKIDARKKFSLLHGLGAIYSATMCDQLINLYLQVRAVLPHILLSNCSACRLCLHRFRSSLSTVISLSMVSGPPIPPSPTFPNPD